MRAAAITYPYFAPVLMSIYTAGAASATKKRALLLTAVGARHAARRGQPGLRFARAERKKKAYSASATQRKPKVAVRSYASSIRRYLLCLFSSSACGKYQYDPPNAVGA